MSSSDDVRPWHLPGPIPDRDDGAQYYLIEDHSGKIPDEVYCSAHLIGEFTYLKKHGLDESGDIYITPLEDEDRFDCLEPGCQWAKPKPANWGVWSVLRSHGHESAYLLPKLRDMTQADAEKAATNLNTVQATVIGITGELYEARPHGSRGVSSTPFVEGCACVDPLARECARATAPSGVTYSCSCPCHQVGSGR